MRPFGAPTFLAVLLAVVCAASVASNVKQNEQIAELYRTTQVQQAELDGLADCIAVTRFVGCEP